MTTAPPHIIVLPGGGYAFRAEHEGEPVAEWLRSLGLESSVLDYPVQTRHPGPIEAARMRVAELRAAGVERLGMLGFSAGGHLAGHAAALGLVDLAVLCYPVVSMLTPTHGGSRRELLGQALARHGVPHALHVYPRGRHGLGLVTGIEGGDHAGIAAHWTRDCAEWLRELGWVD